MNEFIMLNWYHFDLNYKIIKMIKNDSLIPNIISKKRSIMSKSRRL